MVEAAGIEPATMGFEPDRERPQKTIKNHSIQRVGARQHYRCSWLSWSLIVCTWCRYGAAI